MLQRDVATCDLLVPLAQLIRLHAANEIPTSDLLVPLAQLIRLHEVEIESLIC